MLINAMQTMGAVHRYVPTHQDYECVVVEMDLPWLVMEEIVKVGNTSNHCYSYIIYFKFKYHIHFFF